MGVLLHWHDSERRMCCLLGKTIEKDTQVLQEVKKNGKQQPVGNCYLWRLVRYRMLLL